MQNRAVMPHVERLCRRELEDVTGDPCEALIIYKHTGTDATSRLIAYIDTVTGPAALSVTPNGGDITIVFDNGANKIFKL